MIRVSTYNSEYLRPGLYLDEKDPTTLKGGYGEKIHSLVNAIFGPNLTYTAENLVGHRLPNGSFNGVFGKMQRNEIDLHFRGESFRDYPEEQVAFSNVINTRPLLMTHELQVRRYPNEIGNWFTIVAPQLWAVYAVLLALCACLMNKLSSHQICRNSVWTLIQMSLNISVSINSCLHFPLLLFYLPLMFAVWHFNLILFGQLNTNMVSFDRRDVIVKLEDALKIQRIPCWGIEGSHSEHFATAKPGTLPNLIWNRHLDFRLPHRCILEFNRSPGTFLIMNRQRLFGFGENILLTTLVHYTCSTQNTRFWISPRPVQETLVVFYMNRRLFTLNRPRIQNMNKLNVLESHLYESIKFNFDTFERVNKDDHCKTSFFNDLLKQVGKDHQLMVHLNNLSRLFFFIIAIDLISLLCFLLHHILRIIISK